MDFKTLANEVNGTLVNDKFGAAVFEGVGIDSRTIAEKQLFIAIKGEKDDGHNYIGDVLKRSSAGLMVRRDYADLSKLIDQVPMVLVPDTHESMMRLAAFYRKKHTAEFIAITGSNGKTTTKEFVYAMIASRKKKTYRSPGNLNNLFGLPLAVFEMPLSAEYGVFELGISYRGEMTRLAQMLLPDVVLITNVGPTHLETLATVENVAEAKFELVDAVPTDKPVILNSDVAVLMKAAASRNRKYITYSLNGPADFTARPLGISDEGFPVVKINGSEVTIRLFGEHQIYNFLAGFAVCKVLGLDIKPADLESIEYHFAPYRGEISHINGLTVIADCYNANPVSMRSGLQSFRNYLNHPDINNRGNMAVIGDMLELGELSAEFHAEIGELVAELDFDRVVTVGPLSVNTYRSALRKGMNKSKIAHFETVEAAGAFVVDSIKKGDVIYLKASRGIGLERIITLLKGSAFRQN